jgi:hypothetical protein
MTHADHAPPEDGIGGKAALASVGAGLEEVSWGLVVAEGEAAVAFVWHPGDRLVLEDEVAEAVEDRFALVDLDATQEMRPVVGEQVTALVDGPVGERDQEVGLAMLTSLLRSISTSLRKWGARKARRRREIIASPTTAMEMSPRSASYSMRASFKCMRQHAALLSLGQSSQVMYGI